MLGADIFSATFVPIVKKSKFKIQLNGIVMNEIIINFNKIFMIWFELIDIILMFHNVFQTFLNRPSEGKIQLRRVTFVFVIACCAFS